jgi:uncharacterized protein YndB with AHSA1/START domain
MVMTGRFLEIAPPERIVHTELLEEDWTGGETEVTTTLRESQRRTTPELVVRYSSAAARDAALKTGMAGAYDTLNGMLVRGEIAAARG